MSAPTSGPGPLAGLLRSARLRAALSQEELAARSGLTAKAVSALERGERRRPHPHTLRALGDALGLDEPGRAALAAAARPVPDADPLPPVPAPAAPVFGRDDDVAEVAGLLRSGAARLVTLTGPGGVGKTTLALAVARAVAADFPDGVTVAELAPVREARLVLPTLARALGGRQLSGPVAEAVAARLGERRHLVVLDNAEHVLDAAPEVADLLARCPGLAVLATSRAPLRVRAERERPLGPLPLPAGSSAGAVAASPAAQVFLDRAAAAGRPDALTDATAADVAAICRRLDGLPLALELAAAHARYLPPAALLGRLDEALGSGRSRDLPERQRTMRAALDWSHDLLTAAEQELLRRLAVFAGGFSLDAARAVAGGGVLAALGGLVEQSLVLPEEGPEARYRLLEPVRQYAAVRLAASGEAEVVAERATAAVLDLAAGARTGLTGPEQGAWLDRLERDHGNLAAALGRLVAAGRAADVARVIEGTWLYWAVRGNTAEGLGWVTRAARTDPAPADPAPADPAPADAARLLLGTAALRYASGDVPGTRAAAADAARAAADAGAGDLHALALVLTGSAAVFLGDLDAAAAELDEAQRLAEEAGQPWARAHAVSARGQLLLRAGDLGGGTAELAVAERLARELGSPFTLATVLNVQASLALLAGDEDTALARWSEAADLAAEVRTTWTLAYTLPGLAVVAARRGLPDLAARLFAAGSATAEASSVAVAFPPDVELARDVLPEVRATLGETAFGRAWDAGRLVRPADVPALAGEIRRSRGSR
ncbi:putative ATPase [Geodermatophilus normandii]|uniref:Putative ATPase n=1 Tax=Geodermatophilus normandii TaxID=1137989 RepID=A0A317QMA8_9ACTN|nr:helix-turn-helix domain-containing protein [Geodermatophilus normandii]PWW23997.1 putative ATPase [Geodermatophilus normandii]